MSQLLIGEDRRQVEDELVIAAYESDTLRHSLNEIGCADQLALVAGRIAAAMLDRAEERMVAVGIDGQLDATRFRDLWHQLDTAQGFAPAGPDWLEGRVSATRGAQPLTAEAVSVIVDAAVGRIVDAITADKGDVVIQRDSAGAITGVRRSKATD